MIDFEEQFNFTNKLKHPTNYRKVVYRHLVKEQADYFMELLSEANIEFEVQTDHEHEKKPIYIGVARVLEKKTDKFNYIALGKNRAKFIDSAVLRWIVIGTSAVILALAIIGYSLDH